MKKPEKDTPINAALEDYIAKLRRKGITGDYKVAPERPAGEAAEKAVARLEEMLGAKYSRERADMAEYEIYHDNQKPIHKQVMGILGTLPQHIAAARNIVFYGGAGTGKDHMMAALLYAAAKLGFDCEWRNVQTLNEAARDRMKNDLPERELLEALARPKVLGLSDPIPPVGKPSEWNINLLYRILDVRARECRPTWVTLNVTDSKSAVADMKSLLSVPVFDRFQEAADMLPCFWPSWRGKK